MRKRFFFYLGASRISGLPATGRRGIPLGDEIATLKMLGDFVPEDGVYSINPGKMSLSFALATATFEEITGKSPFPQADAAYRGVDVDELVGELAHAQALDRMSIGLGRPRDSRNLRTPTG